MKQAIHLRQALLLADKVKEILAPFCEPDRCHVVGSVRRAREYVNDLDFVLIPRPGQRPALLERAKANTEIIKEGPDIVILRLKGGVQLDLYFAHGPQADDMFEAVPSNWASVYVCRTGSARHNVFLCSRAKDLGLKWETMRGLVVTESGPSIHSLPSHGKPDSGSREPGTLLRTDTEEEFFAALNLEFIPPALRER